MAYKDTNNYTRIDNLLVELGHFQSRSRARDAIKRSTVFVDNVVISKTSLLVNPKATICINDPAQNYVSRAALKLIAALDVFEINISNKICLDIGASTGGFTQVLSERGAHHIIAIDVGHGQFDERLREQGNIRVIEGLNARELTAADLQNQMPQVIVSDVSFISLKLALPPALKLAAPGAYCILLVKPQFEVGRENVRKGGIVAPDLAEQTSRELEKWLDNYNGWHSKGLCISPITGGDGNVEYLLAGQKDD